MSFNHTLSAVLRGRWLIDKTWAEAHIPIVLSLLKGNPASLTERSGAEAFESPYAIDPKTMQRYEWFNGRNASMPDGSVGVIPVNGPITKYDGFCGAPGAITHANTILQMKNRQSIDAVVIHTDTPGGEARAMNVLSSALKRLGKPKLSLVDGMAASGGMWMISETDEVYVSSKMDRVGSVGGYRTILDFTEALKMEGVTLHEIYAPQSTDKNKDFRDALKGDYSLMEKDLEFLVEEFVNVVKTGRPKAAATEKEWNTGKMFYAADGQKLGLHDGIRNLQQVVSKASWLAKRKKY